MIYVDSRLENLTAQDRPIFWTEHATFSSPRIAPGVSTIDLPGTSADWWPAPDLCGGFAGSE